jgi:hypothetical protein
MALVAENITRPSNWLDEDRIPGELKLRILEHISSHRDLVSLLGAYPTWVNQLWVQYPKQLFPGALDNVLEDIEPEVVAEVFLVYQIRKIRDDYATAMGSSFETELHRRRLQARLRDILNIDNDIFPEPEQSLQTILDIATVIQDVNSLTYRYSNDAWKRIHDIAKRTGTSLDSTDVDNPPAINLVRIERFRFNRAFLRVEIYLLTKNWTNAQDQRHILDMGQHIEAYIPRIMNLDERQEFDSCLRYIFHSY